MNNQAKLLEALKWALEWIDAVPQDTTLPAMPGFDRDYVNDLIATSFDYNAECSPTRTQCPRCKNPHNWCDQTLGVVHPGLETVYQVWNTVRDGGWSDTDKDQYDLTKPDDRRIVYQKQSEASCHKCVGNGITHASFCPLYDPEKERAAIAAYTKESK